MNIFLTKLKKNLEMNGIVDKRVAFDAENLYEIADNHSANLNDIREELKNDGIDSVVKGEKIIFKKQSPQIDKEELMKKAQDEMANMTPDQMKAIQEMISNMSDDEKKAMMDQAKSMGIL